ncbi:hypothetical protein [uncultured Zobellia sp.]|uniref:hypothetical protein n=1 Tax=uncultured Zobellia sp. TaxID=255433 RepID=UPI00259653AA|nr:hypothetical protein [uncultured Zobellia sp.]
MDKKIQRLIDGSSELARHFRSEDKFYWIFPKDYIERNSYLKSFLEDNKNTEVLSLFKKDYPQIESYLENYKAPLVKIIDEEYLVHDSVRYILHNYCVFLLSKDLKEYCTNVRNALGIRQEDKLSNRFSYPYHDEFVFREIFLKNIENPNGISNLVSRSFYIKSFLGGRNYINLDHIELLLKRSDENYDYSKLKL